VKEALPELSSHQWVLLSSTRPLFPARDRIPQLSYSGAAFASWEGANHQPSCCHVSEALSASREGEFPCEGDAASTVGASCPCTTMALFRRGCRLPGSAGAGWLPLPSLRWLGAPGGLGRVERPCRGPGRPFWRPGTPGVPGRVGGKSEKQGAPWALGPALALCTSAAARGALKVPVVGRGLRALRLSPALPPMKESALGHRGRRRRPSGPHGLEEAASPEVPLSERVMGAARDAAKAVFFSACSLSCARRRPAWSRRR